MQKQNNIFNKMFLESNLSTVFPYDGNIVTPTGEDDSSFFPNEENYDNKKTYSSFKDFFSSLTSPNEYLLFIKECKEKLYPEGIVLHKHHIVPKHWFRKFIPLLQSYKDSPDNLVLLSRDDHLKAHQILYDMYKRPQDLASTLLLKNDLVASRRIWRQLGAKATNASQKAGKRNFWDTDFQKEMATRSLARVDARETRRTGGKKGGRQTNLNRVLTKNDHFIFFFEGKPVLCIFNCETGTDVLEILKQYKETPMLRVSPLLTGTRKTAYGWSCQKITSEKKD